MFEWFSTLSLVKQAVLASLFTWSITTSGASIVFLFKKINKNILDSMLGLSAGIMIAASFWSLLNPAIELAEILRINVWLIISLGFLSGGIFLNIGDKFYDYYCEKKSSQNDLKSIIMLIISITLHNIPEGLAIGVAFGSLKYNIPGSSLINALILAIGIGIQNFPEGSAVSLPLRRKGFSRSKSFFIGSLTGIVEPIAAIFGVLLTTTVRSIMPFFLSFAAGAMIYVVVKELVPESQNNDNKNMITLWTMIGFTIMMILDVALG